MLALDAESKGLVPSGLQKAKWQSRMATSELFEEQWLLAYGANVKGWLPSVGGGDHVAADPLFSYLKRIGVEFYFPVVRPAAPAAYP